MFPPALTRSPLLCVLRATRRVRHRAPAFVVRRTSCISCISCTPWQAGWGRRWMACRREECDTLRSIRRRQPKVEVLDHVKDPASRALILWESWRSLAELLDGTFERAVAAVGPGATRSAQRREMRLPYGACVGFGNVQDEVAEGGAR